MDMEIVLSDTDRVDARYKGHVIVTHQDGSAPAPFDLFLASMGTCAGIYVSRFCRQRGIPVEGIRLVQHHRVNPETRMLERVELEIRLPEGFPERYRDAVVRTAQLCAVKKHLEHPPEMVVEAIPAAAG